MFVAGPAGCAARNVHGSKVCLWSGVANARVRARGAQPRVVSMAAEKNNTNGQVSSPAAAAVDERPVEERVVLELEARGVDIEDLLNPSKVIKLARQIEEKQLELAQLKAEDVQQPDSSAAIEKLEKEIAKLEKDSETEKRQIMFEWLKTMFLVQGVLGLVISGGLAKGGDFEHDYNLFSALFFGGHDIPLVARALGFWLVWMFSIPSLRARKPIRTEKAALNLAFAIIPLANILAPFATKDPWLIYWGDMVLLFGCYAYSFVFKVNPKDSPKLKGKLKWLDWSSRM